MNNKQNGLLSPQSLETFPMVTQPPIVQTVVQEEEELNLRQLLSVIRHRVLLIGAIALGTTAAISIWTFLKTPIYEGKFSLLIGKPIEENQKNLDLQAVLPQLGGEDIDYDTQIEVLSSPQLLAPVIQKITRQYPGFKEEELIGSKASSLTINQLKKTKVLKISYRDPDPEKIKFVLDNLAKAYLHYSSQERKSEFNQGLDFVTAQLPLLHKQVNLRQQELQQFRQRYNFLDPDKEAQRLSEQFTNVEQDYINARVALNEASSRYQVLQKQVGLDPNQAIVASYLSESPGYQDLLKQLQEVEVELARQSAVFSSNNPIIETLKETRSNLLPLLQQEAQRALGNKLPEMLANASPSLISQSILRVDLTKQLVEAANEQATLQIKVQSLAEAIKTQKSQVQNLAILARRYTDLQREVEISTTSLNRFLEEQQKLQLKVAQQVIPWQIIAAPEVGDQVVSPKPFRNISLGIIGGLLLGLGAAMLAERLDPVYHSTEDLKEDTNLPILGTIPWQKDLNVIEKTLALTLPKIQMGDRTLINTGTSQSSPAASATGSYSSSPFLEAFRTLNTNIRLLGSDSSLRSLVFSSVSPGDGKTTIAINVAKAAASMGQRVLLVDADLRRPQVHVRLDLDNEHGLSNVIATSLDWKEAIQSLPAYEGLSILTAGDIPPDPTRLLSSQKMHDLMSHLQEDNTFDLIIYDLPPISTFADARILAALTTGIILVTKLAKTDRFALKNIIEELKLSQISILGLIANNVNLKNQGYGYYGYYNNQGSVPITKDKTLK